MRRRPSTDPSLHTAPIRFFHVENEMVKGSSGQQDTEDFAAELTQLQLYAQALGAKLGMTSISHGTVSDEGKSMAFRFLGDQDVDPSALKGLLVDRRLPYSEAIALLTTD